MTFPRTPQAAVRQFHDAFGLPVRVRPEAGAAPSSERALRMALLKEEFGEYAEAEASCDTISIADALADMVYVAYGTALTYGIDLDAVIAEVHRANMSKLGPDGRPLLRADGKVMKSAAYCPPDIPAVLAQQQAAGWCDQR